MRIMALTNDKIIASERSSEELAKNLLRHGIDVILDEVDAAGRSIGDALAREIASYNADLPVMGAYGTRVSASLFSGAQRGACCRSRRFLSCFRIDGDGLCDSRNHLSKKPARPL